MFPSFIKAATLALVVSAAPAPKIDIQNVLEGILSDAAKPIEQFAQVIKECEKPEIFNENPELFDLHADIVKIESISNHEYGVSRYLQNYLKKLGLTVETDDSNRNIYAYSGESRNSTVLLTSHIDTVPPYIDYYIEAGTGKDHDVNIHGRGTCDAKGSVAAQIIAAKELIDEGVVSPENVSLLFVFKEEVGGGGMLTANNWVNENNITWDAVIFGEPTENKLATGHKGIILGEVEITGLASHSGYPDVGIDANKILISIMHDLETYKWPTSEILNNTTVNIGLFQGGTAGNVISPHAKFQVVMRTVTGYEEIVPVIKKIVEKHGAKAKDFNLEIPVTDDPVTLDFNVDGFETYIASYATDIPKLDHKGFKRYLYGPGSILVAHGDNEHVSAESLLQAVEDYKKLVKQELGI